MIQDPQSQNNSAGSTKTIFVHSFVTKTLLATKVSVQEIRGPSKHLPRDKRRRDKIAYIISVATSKVVSKNSKQLLGNQFRAYFIVLGNPGRRRC
jgi:hypothetical protein